MAISISELKSMNFGYLTGGDLLSFCPANLLIAQYTVDNSSIQTGCKLAYSRISSNMNTKYEMAGEMAKTGADRSALLVEITSILAVRATLGNLANVSDYMLTLFKRVDKDVLDIRNGQLNLPLKQSAVATYSSAQLVSDSFSKLG